MSKTVQDLKAGDTLVIKRDYSAKAPPRTEVIESIGRVWINLEGGLRVDKITLRGELLTGYIDMASYEHVLLVAKLRTEVRNRINHLTDEEVLKIAQTLGLNEEKKETL